MMSFSQDYRASKSRPRCPRLMGGPIQGISGSPAWGLYEILNDIEWAEKIQWVMIMDGPRESDAQE